MKLYFINFCLLFTLIQAYSQNLLELLEEEDKQTGQITYAEATFKGTRLINGHTIETAGKNEAVFLISHRFDKINSGIYNMFGLDQSTIRLGLEYGISDIIDIGIGRSNYQKLYDGFVKCKILRQSYGAQAIPLSITYLASMAVKSEHWNDITIDYKPVHRLYYIHSILLARKFNRKLSLQFMPVFLHRNFVMKKIEKNNILSLGIGGRYKLTNWISINSEYYYQIPSHKTNNYTNSLSFGFDIETGGHVFQLHFTNSKGMHEKLFIAETTGKWTNADVFFGFNIVRYFSLKTKQ